MSGIVIVTAGSGGNASGASVAVTLSVPIPAAAAVFVAVCDGSNQNPFIHPGTISDAYGTQWGQPEGAVLNNITANGSLQVFALAENQNPIGYPAGAVITYNKQISGSPCAIYVLFVCGASTQRPPSNGNSGTGTSPTNGFLGSVAGDLILAFTASKPNASDMGYSQASGYSGPSPATDGQAAVEAAVTYASRIATGSDAFAPSIASAPWGVLTMSLIPLAYVGNAAGTSTALATFGVTIFAATKQWATAPNDNPSNQSFRGTLTSFKFSRSICQSSLGSYDVGSGELVIANTDGNYDFLVGPYAVDGRDIKVKIVRANDPYANAYLLGKLTATSWTIAVDAVTIELEDASYKLGTGGSSVIDATPVPTQPNLYGGTGGADGTASLTGKCKPIALGVVLNLTMVLIDPTNLIYQVNDGAIEAVTNVYDEGIALTPDRDYTSYATLVAASLAGGAFATSLAKGLVRLGSQALGTPTADVEGDKQDGYLTTTADIVRWFVRRKTALRDPVDLDTASFAAVNSAQPATIGYFVGPNDTSSVADTVANLMAGIGGWVGFSRAGLLQVKIFAAPSGSPMDSFTRLDMMGQDITRAPLPNPQWPPPYKWRVGYQNIWTTQTTGLAGAVSADRVGFLAQAARYATAENDTIKSNYPFAQVPAPVQSYFNSQADAQTEANRLLALFGSTRALWQMTLPRRALRRELGDEIKVTHPRFNLSGGVSMVVVGLDDNVAFGSNAIDSVDVIAYG